MAVLSAADAASSVGSTASIKTASASSGQTTAPASRAVGGASTIREQIDRLKSEQKDLKAQAKKRSRDIRNAERRSKRLKD